jgi:hypothetical protein
VKKNQQAVNVATALHTPLCAFLKKKKKGGSFDSLRFCSELSQQTPSPHIPYNEYMLIKMGKVDSSKLVWHYSLAQNKLRNINAISMKDLCSWLARGFLKQGIPVHYRAQIFKIIFIHIFLTL